MMTRLTLRYDLVNNLTLFEILLTSRTIRTHFIC